MRWPLVLSGAVGIVLAALLYFPATRIGGILRVLVPLREAEIIIFVILLGTALIEMPVMLYGLHVLLNSSVTRRFIYGVNALYVAFAAVYAIILVLLFGESNLSLLLVGLCGVRWLSDWVIR